MKMGDVLQFGRVESWEAEMKGLAVLWHHDVPAGHKQGALVEGLAGHTVYVRAPRTVMNYYMIYMVLETC